MAENRFLFLTNRAGQNDGFKKQRYPGDQEPPQVEVTKTPNRNQQARLRRSNRTFLSERTARASSRTIEIPATIETIIIHFFKVFDHSLTKKFLKLYGLEVTSLEDFNKTVFFEIADTAKFQVFLAHLRDFYSSDLTESYERKPYNLIALIYDFKFLSTKRRVHSFSTISTVSLIAAQTKNGQRVRESLLSYLTRQELPHRQSPLSPDFIEVDGLQTSTVEEIANNFDVIKQITSSRVERRRPGAYNEERRDYGFTITLPDNIPTVGVIDTGFFPVEPLRSAIANFHYDLTSTAHLIDDTGHGTAVGSLIILGEEFLRETKTQYEAKAKIAVIKAMQNDVDGLSVIGVVGAIRQAHEQHGVRLFNLSLNDPLPKGYNRHISDYAYALDMLSHELDIMIVISVGNISDQRLKELIEEEPHAAHQYPRIFYSLDDHSEIHSCESTNISEPSESMNNLSVGAIAGNLEGGQTSDITPGEELPAYYTRKFHYDYKQKINGSKFQQHQRNKHLNKPDLVFDGGDLFRREAGIEIIRTPIEAEGPRYFGRSAGTSLATPLVASHMASIMRAYPTLRMQTIKALIINNAKSPCGQKPHLFRGFPINLLRKLIGFGKPETFRLTGTDNNSVTFVIENEIDLEDFKTITLALPEFLNGTRNKLSFKTTLCYSFRPVKDNHLAYLPLQITFGVFKSMEAAQMSHTDVSDYQVKKTVSWSDDFFGVENRLFSNVQQNEFSLDGELIPELNNRVTLAIRCTAKKEIPASERALLESMHHKFSLVMTITELPASRQNNRLYQDIIAINSVDAIADATGDAIVEADL